MLDIRSILIRVKAACSLLICFAIAEVADAGNVQRIVIDSSSIHDASEIGSFEWSPDGTKYLFDAGVYVVLLDEFSKVHANLFTSSLDGKTVVQLTNDKNVFNGLANWSPDGKSIVFVSDLQDGS